MRNLIYKYRLILIIFASFTACKKTSEPITDPVTIIRPVTENSSPYVSDFFEYKPGPGQLINTSLGNDTCARSIVKNDKALLSLGSWGGYVIYGFDHTVINNNGPDLLVTANALPEFAEPGVVWVMQDLNSNSKPDDGWYELSGSETGKPGWLPGYAVTYYRPANATDNVKWSDNQGDSGFVQVNMFHAQDYYPKGAGESYTLTGTRLPNTNIDTSNSAYVTSTGFAFGYADNSGGGDSLDIGKAVDSTGNTVTLEGIDFIKIQTGILFNMGAVGEQSTEISSIGDLNLLH